MTLASLPPAHLAGAPLDRFYHACALINGRREEEAVLRPYISEGIENGERVILIVDPAERDARLLEFEAEGLDVDDLAGRHQLEVLTWNEAYLRGGRFDQDVMMQILDDTLAQSREMGFPRTRLMGHMEWVQSGRPGVDQLIEYEARVNDVLAQMRQPAVCVYHLDRFDATTLVDVIRTHPVVVMGGAFRENPFFVPAEEFLRTRGAPVPVA